VMILGSDGSVTETAMHSLVPDGWLAMTESHAAVKSSYHFVLLCRNPKYSGLSKYGRHQRNPMTEATITNTTSMVRDARMCRLTKKAEPPPTRDVNRDSGTDSANGGWLRRLVRPLREIPTNNSCTYPK